MSETGEMESYWAYLGDWETECNYTAARIRKDISELPDEYFCVGKDWVNGERRSETAIRIEKALTPYNFFRDRRIAQDALERVKFKQANGGDVEEEVASKEITEPLNTPPLELKWGQEGTATLKDGVFQFSMYSGQKFEIPTGAFKAISKTGGETYYTIRIHDIPTNLFRKGDDKSTLYAVHQAKMREVK